MQQLPAPLKLLDFSQRGPIETGDGAAIGGDQAGFDLFTVGFFVDSCPSEAEIRGLVAISLEDLIVYRTRSDPDILGESGRGEAGGGDNQWLGAHQECILARLSPPVALHSRFGKSVAETATVSESVQSISFHYGAPRLAAEIPGGLGLGLI